MEARQRLAQTSAITNHEGEAATSALTKPAFSWKGPPPITTLAAVPRRARDDRNCAHRVWGDSAFRGQTAVIRDKAPCAVGFTQPHSSRAKNLSKQQLWFAEVAIVDLRKTRIVGRKLRTFESLLESETLAEGVVRPKVAQTTR